MPSFHEFEAAGLRGGSIHFSAYAGQVVLVVNTASRCGFTPQYAGLEALYQTYGEQGFVVLGFPCNQFGRQEPGGVDEISQTCQINYGVSFPMFAKLEVNGPDAHPLFAWLKRERPGLFGGRIQWNFTKFLIGRDGEVLDRFAPITSPQRIAPSLRAALAR